MSAGLSSLIAVLLSVYSRWFFVLLLHNIIPCSVRQCNRSRLGCSFSSAFHITVPVLPPSSGTGMSLRGSYGLSLCHPLRPQPSALQRSASVVLMSTRMSFRLFLPTLTSCRSHLSDFLACAITRVPTRYLLKRAHLRAFPDTPLPAPATPSSLTSTSHQLLTRTVPQICLPGPPRY